MKLKFCGTERNLFWSGFNSQPGPELPNAKFLYQLILPGLQFYLILKYFGKILAALRN